MAPHGPVSVGNERTACEQPAPCTPAPTVHFDSAHRTECVSLCVGERLPDARRTRAQRGRCAGRRQPSCRGRLGNYGREALPQKPSDRELRAGSAAADALRHRERLAGRRQGLVCPGQCPWTYRVVIATLGCSTRPHRGVVGAVAVVALVAAQVLTTGVTLWGLPVHLRTRAPDRAPRSRDGHAPHRAARELDRGRPRASQLITV